MDQLQADTILIHRIDPTSNMARFYALSIEPSLFGGSSLVRNWGRIGTRGRYRIELFKTQDEAQVSRDRILKAKRQRGYCG